MAKNFIPNQRGTTNDKFKIGANSGVDLDTSAVSSPYPFVFPPTAGTSGYVLSTDGTGNLSWVAVGAASDNTTPYFIPTGDAFTNNLYRQNLFETSIDIEGTLVVDGLLIQVD